MRLERVSTNAYALIAPKNRLCDANSGFVASGVGLVVDTQSDLTHAGAVKAAIAEVSERPPGIVVNTHEDLDHVFGNQLFEGAEIIGHRSLPERLPHAADPKRMRRTLGYARNPLTRWAMRAAAPGALAAVMQLGGDYDFEGVRLVPPTRLVDKRLALHLDGLTVDLIHVGPAHQEGDLVVHLPQEDVVFAGDIVFAGCTPIGWRGTFDDWRRALDTIDALAPRAIVPGHGPVTGPEGTSDVRAYLDLVEAAARPHFDAGFDAFDAALRIELGRFTDWTCPARLYANVERAYRGFRGEPPDKPWNFFSLFNKMHRLAKARGLPLEF